MDEGVVSKIMSLLVPIALIATIAWFIWAAIGTYIRIQSIERDVAEIKDMLLNAGATSRQHPRREAAEPLNESRRAKRQSGA